MTAEIAIFNKSAVALAADSAVTVGFGNKRKIYNSANKLFALSKHAPVGVMIYGSAEYKGAPWETLIKMFRHQLGTKKFNTLKEYGNYFLKFIESQKKPVLNEKETCVLHAYLVSSYLEIRNALNSGIEKEIVTKQYPSKENITEMLEKI
ncbi:MAG TPA: hypothetical protein VMW66_00705, partial [Elusimicrobiales bacterium]|nr:hypothetical protein [Elusimicrobiales bacterium]